MCIFHRDFDYLNPFLESRKTLHTYIFLGPKGALFLAVHSTLYLVVAGMQKAIGIAQIQFYPPKISTKTAEVDCTGDDSTGADPTVADPTVLSQS